MFIPYGPIKLTYCPFGISAAANIITVNYSSFKNVVQDTAVFPDSIANKIFAPAKSTDFRYMLGKNAEEPRLHCRIEKLK